MEEDKPHDFYEEFSHLKPELVELFTDLIQVNPYFRPTARECLKNKIFNDLKSGDHSKF